MIACTELMLSSEVRKATRIVRRFRQEFGTDCIGRGRLVSRHRPVNDIMNIRQESHPPSDATSQRFCDPEVSVLTLWPGVFEADHLRIEVVPPGGAELDEINAAVGPKLHVHWALESHMVAEEG